MRPLIHVSDVVKKPISAARGPRAVDASPGKHVVLVLSSDAVAAALLGALVETLGYLVRFFHPPEDPDAAMKRERPSVAMIDCADPTVMKDDVFGHARMRGISVIMFGSSDALRRVRQLALEHALDTLIMPASVETLDETLRKAVEEFC